MDSKLDDEIVQPRLRRSTSAASSIADELEDLEADPEIYMRDAKIAFQKIQEDAEAKEFPANLDQDLLNPIELDADIQDLFGAPHISAMGAAKNIIVSYLFRCILY